MNPLPFTPRAVYGTLLNDRATLERLADVFGRAPYNAPPVAPVLYIKTRNTWAGIDARVAVPADPGMVRIDATLGVVFGRNATRVDAADALACVTGYVIASDITLPHNAIYRPALRQRCRDDFCPMAFFPAPYAGFDPDTAQIDIAINGDVVHRRNLAGLARPVAKLIADVSAFMTLAKDTVLLTGAPDAAPGAHPGDTITITVHGLGSLTHTLSTELPEDDFA